MIITKKILLEDTQKKMRRESIHITKKNKKETHKKQQWRKRGTKELQERKEIKQDGKVLP